MQIHSLKLANNGIVGLVITDKKYFREKLIQVEFSKKITIWVRLG